MESVFCRDGRLILRAIGVVLATALIVFGRPSAPVQTIASQESNDPPEESVAAEEVDAGWLAQVHRFIEEDQRQIHSHRNGTLVANSPVGMRGFFDREGLTAVPEGTEVGQESSWRWRYRLTAAGRQGNLVTLAQEMPRSEANRVIYERGAGITEIWENRPDGLEQIIDVKAAPQGSGPLILEGMTSGDLKAAMREDNLVLRSDHADTLVFQNLLVLDAAGKQLAATMELQGERLRFRIDDREAQYPITVDPLLTTESWTADPTDQVDAHFGRSVATAGDVNGDGYSDVIVGASRWDGAANAEGRAYVYHGSATGLSAAASPDWTADPTDQSSAQFGFWVSTAGDVNGDGYSDVIVGANGWNGGATDEGRAYVYHGSATGLSAGGSPDWTADPTDQTGGWFAGRVSTAGDVNGDGYSDVIVGASSWDGTAIAEGRAYVYHGSATGLSAGGSPDWTADPTDQAGALFGRDISTAGDVNGDGYSDVIVGAYGWDGAQNNEGRAYVYHGGATGLSAASSPDWTADPTDQLDANFGFSVSTAGDVDGDGYSDVIVGAYRWDGAQNNEGRAYVYHGSATGLSAASSPDWTADPTDQDGANFGRSVSTAGDVNGDGYGDVIVGADWWDGAASREGRAYVYHGSDTGLSAADSPDWTADPTDQLDATFGASVSTAGDVDGDGFSDVIVGASAWDGAEDGEGRAYLYRGTGTGLSDTDAWTADPTDQSSAWFGFSVSTAGDVNGDGYSDVIVGAFVWDGAENGEGRVYVYHGSATGLSAGASPDWTADPTDQANASFGAFVSTAGDVNGDGYSDVIVGATGWDGAEDNEGRAYVYHGSASGLSPADSPDWTADPTDQLSAGFGFVATAGDVNGDGYSDVIVGAPEWDDAEDNEGRAYVYHGSATGLSAGDSPDWTADPTDEFNADFGRSVSTAGDVNGDGYSDVIVAAPTYAAPNVGEGRAYVYHGSATGLSAGGSPDWTADPVDHPDAGFGKSVATAGDVNGDGYSDVIVGAYKWNFILKEGRAYVYHGSATGLSAGDSPDWTADPTGQADAYFGRSVSTAGDVNGDGYSDVIVGAYRFGVFSSSEEGRAYVYHGSSTGLSAGASPDWTTDPTDQVSAWFGESVSTAGDVNGDGYSDVIVGARLWDDVYNEGRAYLFYGNGGAGLSVNPRQARGDGSALVQHLGGSYNSDQVRLRLEARTPMGRTQVKLQWEVKELGIAFDLTGLGESSSWTDIGTAGTELDELVGGLASDTPYHWRVRLKYFPHMAYGKWFSIGPNGAEETDFRTPGLDLTPPVAGTVNDGTAADIDWQSSSTTIEANWSGFSDPQSGISDYEWAIGTTSGGTDIQGFTSVGLATTASNATLTLTNGTTYFVTVRATNGAALTTEVTSDGVTVDTSAPIAGTVSDGPGADIDWQTSATTIEANWSGFSDPESGIADYEWAIGTTSGGTQIQAYTSVGLVTSATNSSLTLTDGTTYYVSVRATSGAGGQATSTSDGVTVDSSPPIAGTVNDGTGADIDVQTSTSTIEANWSGFTDPDSGIVDYEWAIGTTSGGSNVQSFTSVGLATSATNSSLTLSSGTTYYVTVRATNEVSLQSTAISDGVTVDTTAPVTGTVNDGTGADIDTQTSTTTIDANWSGFSDPESGITDYEWAIGTTSGGTNVQGFTSVGLSTSATNSSLTLSVGTTYYVTVRATNGVALQSTATSDGVEVVGSGEPDSTVTTSGFYSAVTYSGSIQGTATDNSGTGLSLVEITIQSTSDSLYWDGSGWTGSATWLAATGTDIWVYGFSPEDGETYTVESRATDNSPTVETTPGNASFTYDTTEPTSTVTTAGSYTSATWPGCIDGTASDATSGIAQVEITILRISDGLYWDGTSWGASAVWLTAAGTTAWSYSFAPQDNESYTVESRATDGANNLQSTPSASSFDYALSAPDSTVLTSGAYNATTWTGKIEGTATTSVGANVTQVDITIQNMGTGLYWNGTLWVPTPTWLLTSGTTTWEYFFSPLEGVSYSVQSRASDDLGSVESSFGSATFLLDTTPPTVEVTTEGTYTFDTWVGLIQGTASDASSGIAQVEITLQRLSDGRFWDGSGWGPAPTLLAASGTENWTFPFAPDPDELYETVAQAHDGAGNESASAAKVFTLEAPTGDLDDGSRGHHTGNSCGYSLLAAPARSTLSPWVICLMILCLMRTIARRSTP